MTFSGGLIVNTASWSYITLSRVQLLWSWIQIYLSVFLEEILSYENVSNSWAAEYYDQSPKGEGGHSRRLRKGIYNVGFYWEVGDGHSLCLDAKWDYTNAERVWRWTRLPVIMRQGNEKGRKGFHGFTLRTGNTNKSRISFMSMLFFHLMQREAFHVHVKNLSFYNQPRIANPVNFPSFGKWKAAATIILLNKRMRGHHFLVSSLNKGTTLHERWCEFAYPAYLYGACVECENVHCCKMD